MKIRLLELFPGIKGNTITCRLTHASLDAFSHYEALSYVWDDASNTVSMQVDSSSSSATRNLSAALEDLRDQNDSRVLWVSRLLQFPNAIVKQPIREIICSACWGLVPGYESVVDYDLPAAEVFTRSVLQDIRHTDTLDILSQFIEHDGFLVQDPQVQALPSWVPNWERRYYPYYLNDVACRQKMLRLYNACAAHAAQIIDYDNGSIQLHGIICDDIVPLGSPMSASSAPSWRTTIPKDLATLIFPASDDRYTQLASSMAEPYPYITGSSGTYTDAIARTCCADVVAITNTGEAHGDSRNVHWSRTSSAAPVS